MFNAIAFFDRAGRALLREFVNKILMRLSYFIDIQQFIKIFLSVIFLRYRIFLKSTSFLCADGKKRS